MTTMQIQIDYDDDLQPIMHEFPAIREAAQCEGCGGSGEVYDTKFEGSLEHLRDSCPDTYYEITDRRCTCNTCHGSGAYMRKRVNWDAAVKQHPDEVRRYRKLCADSK